MLLKQRTELVKQLTDYNYERKMLAKLASDTPQFFDPLTVVEAKEIRDRVLKGTS